MKDRTNTKCPYCNKGKLAERSLYDDWEGYLTCGNKECGMRTQRYSLEKEDYLCDDDECLFKGQECKCGKQDDRLKRSR